VGDSELNCEASGESSGLLDKKDETAQFCSLHSGRTVRQYPQSGPSTSTQYEPLQGVKEVRDDYTHNSQSPENDALNTFEVVARGNHRALSYLLTNRTTDVNTIDSKGNTVLHHAVASAFRKGDRDESLQ
jgi:hypothetical protein